VGPPVIPREAVSPNPDKIWLTKKTFLTGIAKRPNLKSIDRGNKILSRQNPASPSSVDDVGKAIQVWESIIFSGPWSKKRACIPPNPRGLCLVVCPHCACTTYKDMQPCDQLYLLIEMISL